MPEAPARVSVIVPTRGRPELLREALASIRAAESSSVSLEILVCDNGNGEGAAPAREFGATYLPVTGPGAWAARNTGISAATGEYLTFLDDDDLWLPDQLMPKIAMLKARPELAAVVGQSVTTDEHRRPSGHPFPAGLPEDGDAFQEFLAEYPQIGSTVVRSSVRETVGLLDESLPNDEDWDWHLRLALHHRVGFIPAVGVLFRQRPAGTFDALEWARLGFMRRVLVRALKRAGPRRPGPRAIMRIALHHHGIYYWSFVQSGLSHVAAGDRKTAWRSATYALVASPMHVALGLLRDRPLRALLAALLFGRPVDDQVGFTHPSGADDDAGDDQCRSAAPTDDRISHAVARP